MKYIIASIITVALSFMAVFFMPLDSVSAQNKCGGVDTSIINCSNQGGSTDIKQSAIWQILKIAITIMTGGVVIAALGGVVYGSIMYTSSGGNPESRRKAMGILTNVAIGAVAYALMWALLNFIIPGGISL